ncbi:MAG TPA: geranylgeranyl reductase family protein [Miltoncostaeaceae bacterium]|nr:geranylgeranyl reductase family protein [Miltoncostaeaceae bacterium]
MEHVDVVVIGAGPAGSTAAYRLAAAGARVVMLDKAHFPRDKPCGGGITWRGVKLIPCSVDPVVEDVIHDVEVGRDYDGRRITRSSKEPLVLMTQRRRLDAHLAEQAAARGADFREGVRVRGIELEPGGATVSADGMRIAADVVIGADGCNGVSAKTMGLGANPTYGVALEGNLPMTNGLEERLRGRLLLEFGTVPGGYAWVFPKGDHANLGVGGWGREGENLRDHLDRLCAEYGITHRELDGLRGYRLPLRDPRSPLTRGRGLVVGDAAGLVDPMSGDGMYEGFLSSKLAAEAVLDLLAGRAADLSAYGRAVDGELSRHRMVSWVGKLLFDEAPRVALTLARNPVLWPRVVRRLRGEQRMRPWPRSPWLEGMGRAIYRPAKG